MRELEAALPNIDAPVFACPGVDRAKPESMQGADIVRGEAMVRSVVIYCVDLRQLQCVRFGRVHIAHPPNAEQIAKHTAT